MKEIVPLIREWDSLKHRMLIPAGNQAGHFNSNELLLFDLVEQGIFEDYKISKEIFNKGPSTQDFQLLKRKIKKNIYKLFIGIDEQRLPKKHQLFVELDKLHTIAQILNAIGLRNNAMILLKKGYKKASNNLMHLSCMNYLRLMIPISSTTYGNDISILYNKLKDHTSEFSKEEEVKYVYLVHSKNIIKLGKFEERQIRQIENDLQQIQNIKSDNAHFHYWRFMLMNLYSQVNYNFGETFNEAQEAIQYFRDNPILSKSRISYFRMVECVAQLKMGEYDDLSHKMLKYQKESKERYRYLRYYEYLIQLYFRSGEYESLQMTFAKLRRESKQPEIDRTFKFRMNLYEYYFYLLHLGGKVESKEKDSVIDKRFRKYAERIKGDKSGFNVPVLIGELLRFSLTDRLDIVVDRIDAMRQYTYKHLNDPDNIRSKTFINMLSKLPGRLTNLKKFEKDIEKGLQVLKDNPLNKSRQADEMEIIPYEDLWDMVRERVLGVSVT